MTAQEDALAQIAALLDAERVPYMVIGGLANIVWGEPRATLDIDVTVWLEDAQIQAFVDRARSEFRLLVDNPIAFIAETRVLPVETASGIRVDVLFGLLPFGPDENRVRSRSRHYRCEGDREAEAVGAGSQLSGAAHQRAIRAARASRHPSPMEPVDDKLLSMLGIVSQTSSGSR